MNIYRKTEAMDAQAILNAQTYADTINDVKKQFSILHPYKHAQTALHLINPFNDFARSMHGLTIDTVFPKIDPTLFKDRDFSLQALEEVKAFPYVDKQLRNDPEFLKAAITKNHLVFDVIDPQFKRLPEIKEAYIQSLLSSRSMGLIERGDTISLPPTLAISPAIDPKDVFTVDRYAQAFENALHKPYEKDFRMDEHLSKSVALIVAAQTFCPEMANEYRAVEKEILLNNPEFVEKVILDGYAKHYPEARSLIDTLEEVFADVPELMDKFEELKKQSWELQAQRVLDTHTAMVDKDGTPFDKYQITLALTYFDEMKKYVPLTQDLKYALQLEKDPRWDRAYDSDGLQYECDLDHMARR